MWFRGIDGSMVKLTDPANFQMRYDNFDLDGNPRTFIIGIVVELIPKNAPIFSSAYAERKFVVICKFDNLEDAKETYEKKAQEINTQYYIAPPEQVPLKEKEKTCS